MGKRWSELDGTNTREGISCRSVYVHFYWALSLLLISQKKRIVLYELDSETKGE